MDATLKKVLITAVAAFVAVKVVNTVATLSWLIEMKKRENDSVDDWLNEIEDRRKEMEESDRLVREAFQEERMRLQKRISDNILEDEDSPKQYLN